MADEDVRRGHPAEPSIAELFLKLIDEGRAFVRAEAGLYKQIAAYRASKARNGAIALGVAFVLVIAGFVAALLGIVLGLAKFVGPVGAGLIVFAVAAGTAYGLVRYGIGKLAALGGDPEERLALFEGERRT